MKTAAVLVVASLASFAVLGASVGCAAPAPDGSALDDGSGNEETSTKAPSKKKSTPTPAPAPAPNAPAPTPAPTDPAPAPPPPVDPTPTNDPAACSTLGQCCSQIVDNYGRLACLGVSLAGKPELCAQSLIACQASVGMGSSSSGGSSSGGAGQCMDDFDCPGNLFCEAGKCVP